MQAKAAQLLGMYERSFRRYLARYEAEGIDRRLEQVSNRRERSALPGMMIHQDGTNHEWVVGQKWDLVVTIDDATSWHYSVFFVDQEGTTSSFRGVHEVIIARGRVN